MEGEHFNPLILIALTDNIYKMKGYLLVKHEKKLPQNAEKGHFAILKRIDLTENMDQTKGRFREK